MAIRGPSAMTGRTCWLRFVDHWNGKSLTRAGRETAQQTIPASRSGRWFPGGVCGRNCVHLNQNAYPSERRTSFDDLLRSILLSRRDKIEPLYGFFLFLASCLNTAIRRLSLDVAGLSSWSSFVDVAESLAALVDNLDGIWPWGIMESVTRPVSPVLFPGRRRSSALRDVLPCLSGQ